MEDPTDGMGVVRPLDQQSIGPDPGAAAPVVAPLPIGVRLRSSDPLVRKAAAAELHERKRLKKRATAVKMARAGEVDAMVESAARESAQRVASAAMAIASGMSGVGVQAASHAGAGAEPVVSPLSDLAAVVPEPRRRELIGKSVDVLENGLRATRRLPIMDHGKVIGHDKVPDFGERKNAARELLDRLAPRTKPVEAGQSGRVVVVLAPWLGGGQAAVLDAVDGNVVDAEVQCAALPEAKLT